MAHEEKLVSHYQLKTLLRKDGFGAVYLAGDTRDGNDYVLRIIELDPPTLARITGRVRARAQRDHPLIEGIRQRMKRISELKHAHVLPVLEFGEEHVQGNNDIIFYMASPYEKESLLSYWSEHYSSSELLTLEVIADLIFQAGEALYAVHKRGLTHQYVRLSSFMLHTSTRGRRHLNLLLTDFWFADITAAILEEGQNAQALSVYLAPEQMAGSALAASDQYALAILAYELLLGYRLSQVDLSQGLYERALRQRSAEVSEAELLVASRLDLVLARALAEAPVARFQNIEEFAYTFRAVARGEAVDLTGEATFKLPSVSGARGGEIVVAAAGALVAGELIAEAMEADSTAEMLAAAEADEAVHPEHHHGLHKTVLTSEGMEVVQLAETGEVFQQEADIATEQTQVVEGGSVLTGGAVGFAAGVAAGFAAGVATGEALQQEADISAEQTQIIAASGASFAAGVAAGEAMAYAQEADVAAEQTQVVESGTGGALAAGAVGLVAGGLLASGIEAGEVTQAASTGLAASAGVGLTSGAGAGLVAGGFASGAGASGGGRASRGGRGWRRWLVAAIAALVLLAVVGAGIFVFAANQSTATVTLTLQSRAFQNSYLVTAVTSSSSSTQGQVQASMLTQSASQSKSGQASGFFAGSHATGFITFRNSSTGCGCPTIIPAGTTFKGASGVTIVTDTVASVAAQCTVTVRAHAVPFGPGGDIPSNDINANFNANVTASNPLAFGGGQPSQSNAIVTQSDIDGVANSLQSQVVQSAQTSLQSQVTGTEHLLGTPDCQAQTNSDHAAGDSASSFTVTVNATCTAEAYDYAGAVQIVQQEVQTQAASYFGSQFVLVGSLQTTVTSATLTDAKAGTILLAIEATGKWAYHFGNSLKQSLATVIAGKNVSDARTLLASQSGVSAVNIAISGDQSKLPSDASKITIVLKS